MPKMHVDWQHIFMPLKCRCNWSESYYTKRNIDENRHIFEDRMFMANPDYFEANAKKL